MGYGGTKTEMERLLKDAQALTGVEYNIDNLGDVYEAIHVIQGELGLTGVAAEEASQTFSGSFNAMKASLKNFFGSLALGEDIKPALQGLLTSVDTFVFNNLIPMIGTIVKGLPTVIWTFLSEGIPMLLERISSFLQTGAETLKGLASNLSGEKVKAWAVETIPKLITAAGEMIKNFATSLVTNLPEIIKAIGQIGLSIVTGLGSALWPKIKECAVGIKDRFMEPINNMRERVHAAIQSLKDGFLQRVYSIRDTIGGIASAIRNKFLAPIENLRDKVKGIIDKIKGFFSFSVSIPHIPLPHFYISPSGWRLGDLLRGSIPSLGISWYAKGGIATNPSIVGIGEGTSDEAILPLDPFWKRMDKLAESVEKNGKGGDITINVYAAPGMDVNAIAEAVERKMISAQNSRRAAWGV